MEIAAGAKQRTRTAATIVQDASGCILFNYGGRDGDLIKLSFTPNPNFQPPSLEAHVSHDMEGEL